MARQAVLSQPRFIQTSRVLTLPGPSGGWNASVSLANMPPLDAIKMENFDPTESGATLRKGDTLFVRGLLGRVDLLIPFNTQSEEYLIAAATDTIWSLKDGVKTSLGTGFSNSLWQAVNYNNRLILVNGEDTPQVWDNATLTDFGFTGSGLDVKDLSNVTLIRNRLWFIEKDTGTAWYGGLNSIAGTLTPFDVGEITRSGKLINIANWSRDSGSGVDDLTVFIFDNGPILVYSGDPVAAPPSNSQITIRSNNIAPRAIGPNCTANIDGELVIITKGGYFTMANIEKGLTAAENALSGKIRQAVATLALASSTRDGWSITESVSGASFIFNVPTTSLTFEQHVFNSITGAWGKWIDRNMVTFTTFDGKLYGGSINGNVYIMDSSNSDDSNGTTIVDGVVTDPAKIKGTVMQAYNSLTDPDRPLSSTSKQVTALRPAVSGNGVSTVGMGVLTDFRTDTQNIIKNQTFTFEIDNEWQNININWNDLDTNWEDLDTFGVISPMLTVNGTGRSIAIVLNIETDRRFEWNSTDIIFRLGGIL